MKVPPMRDHKCNRSRMFCLTLSSMAVISAISGCAGPMGELHQPPPGLAAVTAFDGSYHTTIRVSNSPATVAAQTQSWCDTPGQSVITVAGGQLAYTVPHPNLPGTPAPIFEATFAQDGSFLGQVINGTMSGRVTGSHITGKIDGQGCLYAFDGNRM